jgi:hypothetical protein
MKLEEICAKSSFTINTLHPNIIMVIKPIRKRYIGHVAYVRDMRNLRKDWSRNLEDSLRIMVQGRRMLMLIVLKKGVLGMDWIHLAQDRAQWLKSVGVVMNIWRPLKVRNC